MESSKRWCSSFTIHSVSATDSGISNDLSTKWVAWVMIESSMTPEFSPKGSSKKAASPGFSSSGESRFRLVTGGIGVGSKEYFGIGWNCTTTSLFCTVGSSSAWSSWIWCSWIWLVSCADWTVASSELSATTDSLWQAFFWSWNSSIYSLENTSASGTGAVAKKSSPNTSSMGFSWHSIWGSCSTAELSAAPSAGAIWSASATPAGTGISCWKPNSVSTASSFIALKTGWGNSSWI